MTTPRTNSDPYELWDSDPYELWDAAYVLGALPASERRDYEQHVDGCARCRRRLAGVSGLPGLLGLAEPASIRAGSPGSSAAPAQELPVNVAPYAAFARKVRRRRAGIAAAAAAAVLALVTGTAAVTAGLLPDTTYPATQSTPGPGTAAVRLAFTTTGQQVLAASGQAQAEPWGTRIAWTCTYRASATETGAPASSGTSHVAEEPHAYELVVVTKTGERISVASWRAAPGSTVTPVATTTIPVSAMQEMIIQSASPAGTGTPLLRARL
ncbi:zf-HC2 domain-containing protein [Specibacter sp. RAF43]|uniref:zf-HC2 domain-containing protein n=1 Tax=Specibacter sp. RAF43 TaxID=3233057 RepID=UPI003F966279